MSYTYRLNGAWVNPEGDWEISYQRNEGQIFFRRIFTGELTFWGDDYQTLMGFADCDVLEFEVWCKAELWWEGQFKFPYDFEINEDSCVARGEPEVVDEYSCIMDKYDTEYSPSPSVPGATVIQVRSCAGALLRTLPQLSWRLGEPSGGGNENLLDELINVQMGCNLTLASSFMWRENFPNGTNYAGAYGANNYITGAANRLEYIFGIRNSSLRNAFGGTACSGFQWNTFKEFEDLLRNRFNAYWFIDENGDFRIEHIHFFDPDFPESDFEVSIDLNTLVSSNGKVFAYRKNKYTYETGVLYDQEIFTWQHYDGFEGGATHGGDFDAPPIYYGAAEDDKSDCVPGVFKERDIATPNFWTDVPWWDAILTAGNPDTLGCPGWLLMDVDTATNWVRCETGRFTNNNIINGHLSTANLQALYHTYDRVFLTGTMLFGSSYPTYPITTFDTAQRVKLQEEIEFTWCCDDDFDPKSFIRTGLGNGRVKAATHKKRSIIVELLY